MKGVRVHWLPGSLTFEAARGERLLDALDAQPQDRPRVKLPTACRSANCGTCRVRVITGESGLIPADPWEASVLQQHQAAPDERLGCQICFNHDASCTDVALERSP